MSQYTLTRQNGIRHTANAPYREYLNVIAGNRKNSRPDVWETKKALQAVQLGTEK